VSNIEKRVVIAGRQLAVVLRGWLRSTPERLWGSDANYAKLNELKRHDPEDEPDPRRDVAEYVVARLEELDWQVTCPEPETPNSPPPYAGHTRD
jgi:hypothetical protein